MDELEANGGGLAKEWVDEPRICGIPEGDQSRVEIHRSKWIGQRTWNKYVLRD